MSEFTDILTSRLDVKRLTAVLLEKQAIADSLTPDRQPQKACRLAVEVAGATISGGLVNIAGSTTETLNFSENGIKVGTKDFTSISGITISDIQDGTIEIKAVSRTGHPINQEVSVYSNLPIRFYARDGKIRMMATGQEKIAKYKFMAEPDKVIKENDLIYAVSGIQGLTRGQISFIEEIIDFAGLTHHKECEVQEL